MAQRVEGAAPVTKSGLIGRWKLDDSTGAVALDSSGHDRDGTLTNGPTWTTGTHTGALSFDGVDDYVVLPNMGLSERDAWSFATWVRDTSTGTIYHESATDNWSVYMRIVVGGGVIGYSQRETCCAEQVVTGTTSVNDGQWHHVAVVKDGGTLSIYVDGGLDTDGTLTYNPWVDMATLGAYRNTGWPDGTQHLAGKLDEVQMYHRALSPGDVMDLYSSAVFTYNGEGRRIKKKEGTQTTIYANKYYEKNLTTGEVTTYYYHGGKLVALRKGTALEYVHQDHLGGTAVTTDASGATKSTLKYYPFGETRSSAGTLGMDHKFTGQHLDGTGLYFYNARYYDPGIGRFISADNIVPGPYDPQVFNLYSYVRNNPLRYVDPTGRRHEGVEGQLVKAQLDRTDLTDAQREAWQSLWNAWVNEHAPVLPVSTGGQGDGGGDSGQVGVGQVGSTTSSTSATVTPNASAIAAVVLTSVGRSTFVLDLAAGTTIFGPAGYSVTLVAFGSDTITIRVISPDGKAYNSTVTTAKFLGLSPLGSAEAWVPDGNVHVERPISELRVGLLMHEIVHVAQYHSYSCRCPLGTKPASWGLHYKANEAKLEDEADQNSTASVTFKGDPSPDQFGTG